ncbi:MAG: LysR substrate-binding domain-containing protein [Bacteroidota bacterium]
MSAGLGSWIRELRRAHPRLSIYVRASDQVCDLVAEGFDLQISTFRPSQTTFGIKRILTARLPLAAHRSYLRERTAPIEPADLLQHECLRFFREQAQQQWTLIGPGGKRVHAPVQGSILSDNSQVLFNALNDGLGIGMTGLGYLNNGDHELVRVLEDWTLEPMPLYATTPPAVRNEPHIAAFTDVAVRGFAQWSDSDGVR